MARAAPPADMAQRRVAPPRSARVRAWPRRAAAEPAPRLGVQALGLLLLLQAAGVGASNASAPHPHQGLIPRFKLDGKPAIGLSSSDLQQVEAGQLWMESKEVNGVGRGIGVRDIAAPFDVVWEQISGLEAYVGKVPMLSFLKVYSRSKKGSEIVEKATYVVRVIPGYNFEYYVEHHADKGKKQLVFFLDYDRYSDFNDLQGKWYLEDHPTKPGWTRVYYQCDLKLFGYAPAIVKKLLTSTGLSSAISWVKRESEKRAPQLPAAGADAGQAASAPESSRSPYLLPLSAAAAATVVAAAAVRLGRRGVRRARPRP